MTQRFGRAPATRGWKKFCHIVAESSQAEIAARIRIAQQTVSAYCRRDARPTDTRRQRIAKVLGIPENDWLTAEERRYAEAS